MVPDIIANNRWKILGLFVLCAAYMQKIIIHCWICQIVLNLGPNSQKTMQSFPCRPRNTTTKGSHKHLILHTNGDGIVRSSDYLLFSGGARQWLEPDYLISFVLVILMFIFIHIGCQFLLLLCSTYLLTSLVCAIILS